MQYTTFDMQSIRADGFAKLMNSTIVPRPIAWVTTKDIDGKINAAPFSHFNVVSANPPLICFGIVGRGPGDFKDTGNIIRRTGQFVVNLVDFDNARNMNITAIDFDNSTSELDEAKLNLISSETVAAPRIFGSPVSMECERYIDLQIDNNHIIMLARVLRMHVRADCVLDENMYYIDTPKLDLIARMHGRGWYARTSHLFEMPRIPVEDWVASGQSAANSQS